MRLIRYCGPFFAALSFFVAVPASADLIYQFNGVCNTYWNQGVTSEPVPCDTLANPAIQLTLHMDPAYESVGSTECDVGNPNPCLIKTLEWRDHADATGAGLGFFANFEAGSSCEAFVSGFPPDVSVLILFCAHLEVDGIASVGFDTPFLGFHIVEGVGVWTIDEPTTLALAALALFPLAFVRRR